MKIISSSFKKICMIAFAVILGLTGICVTQSHKAYAYSTSSYTAKVYITTANVNVRKGPGTSYASYGILPQYTAIEGGQIEGIYGGWAKVRVWNDSSEAVGYISSSYLQETTSNRVYSATSNVNQRRGPGLSYSIESTFPANGGARLMYNYIVSADGYNWVANYNCDMFSQVGSSGYYVCSKAWTVFSYFQ